MNPQQIYSEIIGLTDRLHAIGTPLQVVVAIAAVLLAACALIPQAAAWRGRALIAMTALLVAGEGVLAWYHYRLWQLAVVVDPATGMVTGHVAPPLWIESEKLYVWALITALMGVFMRRHRDELLPGVMLAVAALAAAGVLLGQPFTDPLPGLLGQYSGYLDGMAQGGQAAFGTFQGMEAARQYYYNAWFMWVHPPLLFFSYGAFTLSFLASLLMMRHRHSAYETTAYRWARFGYLPLTFGMLIGFPWALAAWTGEAWWWSGKVNMSIMMWLLYTAVLHARLYLRQRGMWKVVASLAVLSFVILILTYITTYVVPGAHSYAALPDAGGAVASAASRLLAVAMGGGA
jgi:cytochrome c biogenesis factor